MSVNMSPFRSATYNTGVFNNGTVAIDANNDLIGLRELTATGNVLIKGDLQVEGTTTTGTVQFRPARMENANSGFANVNVAVADGGVIFGYWKSGLNGSGPSFGLKPAEGYVVDKGPLVVSGTTQTNSFKTEIAGYYRFTNTMFYFQNTIDRTNIFSRFAKSQSGSDASVDANYTDFGPTGASAYIRNESGHNNASTTISDIVHCNVGDHIGVRLSREANVGFVAAPTGHSNFIAELLYPGSA